MKAMKKSVSVAIGALLVNAAGVTASANPFGFTELPGGYQQEQQQQKQEMRCGGNKDAKKAKEGKCGEGKCGEGKCGGDEAKEHAEKHKEGKCGEGKCGGDKAMEKMDDKAKERMSEKAKEGKCGEGKCGA